MEFDTSTDALGALRTEQVDAKFHMLDVMSVSELLSAMNESDAEVPKAVALQLPAIEKRLMALLIACCKVADLFILAREHLAD